MIFPLGKDEKQASISSVVTGHRDKATLEVPIYCKIVQELKCGLTRGRGSHHFSLSFSIALTLLAWSVFTSLFFFFPWKKNYPNKRWHIQIIKTEEFPHDIGSLFKLITHSVSTITAVTTWIQDFWLREQSSYHLVWLFNDWPVFTYIDITCHDAYRLASFVVLHLCKFFALVVLFICVPSPKRKENMQRNCCYHSQHHKLRNWQK